MEEEALNAMLQITRDFPYMAFAILWIVQLLRQLAEREALIKEMLERERRMHDDARDILRGRISPPGVGD